MAADTILLTAEALDPRELSRGLGGEADGAMITFSGVVRRMEGELPLRAIEYQAYDGMARRQIHVLLDEAHAKWPRFRAVVAHRVGAVAVGDVSIWIGVAAGHRAEAFDVARFLIDELKRRVPIWKREHLPLEGGASG